jgi:hypothetical protein
VPAEKEECRVMAKAAEKERATVGPAKEERRQEWALPRPV